MTSAVQRKDQHLLRGLIAWPLTITWRATRLGFHLAEEAVTVAFNGAEWLIEAALPEPREAVGAAAKREPPGSVEADIVVRKPPSADETPPTSPPPPAARVRPQKSAEAPQAEPPAAPRAEPAEAPPRESPRPAHVSEDVELVQSFADPGAEDGAGSAVHVEEPWKGYRQMTAQEIIARIAGGSREELAAVELYERVHRRRQTVLVAADRQLRRATAAARAPQSRRSGDGDSPGERASC